MNQNIQESLPYKKAAIEFYNSVDLVSSLQGYVLTTYDYLLKTLGQPDFIREGTYSNPSINDGDGKVSTEWMTKTFTVYDWKLDETPKGLHRWHIGGMNKQALKDFENATGLITEGY